MGAKYLLIQDLSQQGSMTLPYQEFAPPQVSVWICFSSINLLRICILTKGPSPNDAQRISAVCPVSLLNWFANVNCHQVGFCSPLNFTIYLMSVRLKIIICLLSLFLVQIRFRFKALSIYISSLKIDRSWFVTQNTLDCDAQITICTLINQFCTERPNID